MRTENTIALIMWKSQQVCKKEFKAKDHMMEIAGLTEPTVKEWEKVKDRIHTVAGKESQAQVPRMFHLILQRVKTIISLFEKVYRSSSKFFLLILAS